MSAEMLTGDDVVRVVREIWEYMLMLPLAPLEGADWEDEPGIVACVQIVGGWYGGVCLSFSTGLASLSAAALTGVEEAEVTREQARDAAGELANIAAGSIKLLLPGPSYLSLPVAASGSDYSLVIKGGRRLLNAVFGYGRERLSVAIIERSEASGTIDLIAVQSRQIQ
jgi:chemotaxis protein CheX